MTIELPPQYDPKAVEAAIYKKWLDAKAFHAVPDERPVERRYSIVIPPPNVTGALHLGHAINGTIQDILTRYHRMRGDNTMWMPGIDHAGIATQAVVEKTIFEKEKKNRHDLGREELVRRIWEWKEQFGTRILNQLQSIGSSCDWDRTRFTLDEVCAKAVREAFFKMFKDGLIFRGKRLVNWDTHLQTAVADDEIYHETVKGQMTSIKYPVAEGAPDGNPGLSASSTEYLIVATTRPETMLGDTAVAVHPDDPRYTHLHGKFVILPLVGRRIPVICDGLLVDPKFGTGVVKVTPAHDPNDYATGQRHNLEQINLLTADGKVNENGAGEFLGKKYSYTGLKFATAARKQVLADLEELGLVAEKKVHEHEVGHSDRSKTPIEPYLSDQWFVRMGDIGTPTEGAPDGNPGPTAQHSQAPTDLIAKAAHSHAGLGITLADGTKKSGLAQAAIDAVTSGRVRITPERYAKGYVDWLAQKRDWCISRQLWWGHRIPVWTATWPTEIRNGMKTSDYDDVVLAFEDYFKEYEVSADVCIRRAEDSSAIYICAGSSIAETALNKIIENSSHFKEWAKSQGTTQDQCAEFPSEGAKEACFELHYYHLNGLTRDPDVLDTWFSSALWPLSTMGWPAAGTSTAPEDQLVPYFYPTAVLSTARDILTLWVARMVMFGLYCHGDVPFKDVLIHPVIQDGEGRIMSKTKGNGVDPVEIIESHGADALRFTLASMATETQDIRMPVVKDAKTGVNTSPKFDIGRNFANKIWNAARYILSNVGDISNLKFEILDLKALEDRWIVSRLNATIRATEEAINGYRFAELAEALRTFFWTDLCDWYLEISKARIKQGDPAVQAILLHCLETSLKLLHPMMPFISEEIWSKVLSPSPLWRLPDEAGIPLDRDFWNRLEILHEWVAANRATATWGSGKPFFSSDGGMTVHVNDTSNLFIRVHSADDVEIISAIEAFGFVRAPTGSIQGPLLVTTAWPKFDASAIDDAATRQMALIQSVTSAIREIQNRYPAAKGKPVILQPRDAATRELLDQSRTIIEALAGITIAENSPTAAKPENAAATVLAEAQIFIGGVIDKSAETVKLTKRREELIKFIASGKAKMENAAAVAKAPPNVVQGWRDQLTKQEEELAAVERNLAELA